MRIPRGPVLSIALLVLVANAGARTSEPTPPPAPEENCVVLKPFVVKDRPITCFGLSLCILADPQTRQVARIFVERVLPDSQAANEGVRVGTEILAADNLAVSTFPARFDPGTELNRLFLDRRVGERITLKVVTSPGASPRVVTLTHGVRGAPQPLWSLPDSP